jgi:hypothetical protein
MKKNYWKLIALASMAAFAVSVGSACAVAVTAGPGACANQPNMADAVGALSRARDWLARAEMNKGGWRDAAIDATGQAIGATVAGCRYANGG